MSREQHSLTHTAGPWPGRGTGDGRSPAPASTRPRLRRRTAWNASSSSGESYSAWISARVHFEPEGVSREAVPKLGGRSLGSACVASARRPAVDRAEAGQAGWAGLAASVRREAARNVDVGPVAEARPSTRPGCPESAMMQSGENQLRRTRFACGGACPAFAVERSGIAKKPTADRRRCTEERTSDDGPRKGRIGQVSSPP